MGHTIYTTKALKFYDENGNTVVFPIDSLKYFGESADEAAKAFNSIAVSLEDITIPLVISETKPEDLNEESIDISEFLNT